MIFLRKVARLLNWILFLYLLIIAILLLNGNVTFGYGLGDILYLFALGIAVLLYLTLILFFKQKRFADYRLLIDLVLSIIYLVLAILVTYKITVWKRGRESLERGYLSDEKD